MSAHNINVHVIRKLDGDAFCPDKRTCDARLKLSNRPGRTFIVGKVVTDPAEAAALGQHIGPGEAVVMVDDAVFEEG